MSTRPTTPIPTWSTSGSNLEPAAGKKAAGWAVNERPPAQWLNWLQNSAGVWLQFLADATSGSATPDLKLNFSNTDMLAPLLDVTTAPPASGYRLLQRVLVNASQHVNVYAGNTTRRLVFAFNATWGGATWTCENTAQGAAAIALLGDGSQSTLELLYHAASAATWLDAAWARGNALVNGFNATTGTFTNLTVTQDLTVQRDATVARNLTVETNITVTHDITAEDIISNTHSVDQLYARTGGPIIVNASAAINGALMVNDAHLYLDADVDIVHPGPAASQPTRYVCLDISRGKQWTGSLGTYEDGNGRWVTTPSGGTATVEFPLEVHRATLRVYVHVVWEAQTLGEENKITLIRWPREFITGVSLTPPGPWEAIGTALVQGSMPSAAAACETKYWDYDFDPTLERYAFVLEMADGTRNRVYAVRYGFADPGPRNG